MITASSAALAHACQWSFRPDVELPPEPTPTGARSRGTAFARLCEHRIHGGPTPPLSELVAELGDDEGRRLVAMWGHASRWLDAHLADTSAGWCAERAFAYDPTTDVGRELTRREHRDYSEAKPGEVCGTADLLAVDGDTVVCYDWKTSAGGAPEPEGGATAQLEWLALMAARAWGHESARIVTLRVTEDGVEEIEGEALDAIALDEIAARIADDLARVPTSEPQPGDHCRNRYCKAIAVCPVTREAMAPALLPVEALARRYPFTTAIESPDHLQALLQMRSMVDAASDAVKKAITEYVGDKTIECTDGTTIKATYRTMPREDRAQLVALVKSLGGTQEQLDACVFPKIESAGIKASKPKKARKK